MSDGIKYVPMLKAKSGEFKAIMELEQSELPNFIPVFDIPLDKNNNISTTLQKVLKYVRSYWPKEKRAFLDFFDVDFDDVLAEGMSLDQIYAGLDEAGMSIIPVTWYDREESYNSSLLKISQEEICFRIPRRDLEEIGKLNLQIDDLAERFGLEYDQINLIIDMRQLTNGDADFVRKVINNISLLDRFKSLMLASSSWPRELRNFESNALHIIPRADYSTWLEVCNGTVPLARQPIYADYCMVSDEYVDLDFRIIDIGAKIKYATSDSWILVRGAGTKKNPLRNQMPNLSRIVIDSGRFTHGSYSWGDQFILNCASGSGKTGNHETWAKVGINRHIHCVLGQISNSLVLL